MKSTLNDLSATLVSFEGTPQSPADERLLEFVRRLRPMTSSELRLTRIGGATDGGYVMAEPVSASGAVSVGVGSDVSWDSDIGARGVRVAMFDHTVRGAPAKVPNGDFHRIGISPQISGRTRPLDQLVALAGFTGKTDLILKMDVEGAEWAVLAGAHPEALEPFVQIVLEFHGLADLKDPARAPLLISALRRVTASHYPIHVHANNYDELVRFGQWWFPNAIEVSFVRHDQLPGAKAATSMRTDLDAPCDPRVTEIDLSALVTL